jgi:hypothetical protein
MSIYSIEKKGADFVVKADQQDILKFSTRRLALAMVREAKSLRGASAPQAPADPAASEL